jgi:1-acyl-sn-glycerol-3-phosphate acyltransferase
MEFALVLVLTAAIKTLGWWRAGWRFKEVVFFGTIRLYCHFWHRWSSPGGDRVPATGPVLLISNHTCSADPPLLQTATRRVLSWLSSREHYEQHWLVRKLLDTLHCVPVRRDGRDAMAARSALQRLREGRAVCVFPEGNLSGVALGKLRTPKAGAAWLALRSGAVVIPAFIRGGPQTHRLVRAWAGRSPRPAVVRFGRPVDLARYRGRRITRPLLEEVSALLMARITELGPTARKGKHP